MDIIASPRLLPFASHRVCPGCGADMLFRHRVMQRLFGGADRHMRQQLCPGGKEPTETASIPTIVGVTSVEYRFTCAGISQPHLHITCCNCGFKMITHTRVPLVEQI